MSSISSFANNVSELPLDIFLITHNSRKKKMAACPAFSDWFKLNVVFIRHGESSNNTLYEQIRAIHGNDISPELFDEEYNRLHLNDPGLSERGMKQAQKLGEYIQSGGWKTLVKNSDNWDILSSPQLRALLTAQEVSKAFNSKEVTVIPFIHESDGCYDAIPEGGTVGRPGLSASEVETKFLRFKCAAGMEDGWYKRPQKESRSEYHNRVDEIIEWLWKSVPERCIDGQERGVIIVAHGNLIGKLVSKLVGGHGMVIHSNAGYSHVHLYVTKPHVQPVCAEKHHVYTLPDGSRQIRVAAILEVNNVHHLLSTPELIAGHGVFDDAYIQEYFTLDKK